MRTGACRGQSGFSLLEVLLAIALSGIVVSAIAGAMLTLNKVIVDTARHQKVTTALTSFAESIKGLDYVNCGSIDDDYDYRHAPGALSAAELGVDSLEIIGIEFWVKDTGDHSGQGDYVAPEVSPCASGGPVVLAASDPGPLATSSASAAAASSPDQGAQLFTIEVRLGDVVQRTTVAKRRP